MSLAFTKKIELGFVAPYFQLLEPLTGKKRDLNELASSTATVVMFICNHCPYVKHINAGLVKLANDYIVKGISFIAINPNDAVNYPDDSPENMIKIATKHNFPFPYLFDKNQEVAKAYKAVCTPDFSVFNEHMECIYRGQLDNSRPGNNIAVTGKDIRTVLDALLTATQMPKEQIPSSGCSIKWKHFGFAQNNF